MQDKGYEEFDFRTSIQLPVDPADTGIVGLLEPSGIHRLRDGLVSTARGATFEYLANHPKEKYEVWNDEVVKATEECHAKFEGADDEQVIAVTRPAGLDELLAAWYGDKQVQAALLFDADTPAAKDYAACMGERGYGDGAIAKGDEGSPGLMGRLLDEVSQPDRDDWRMIDDAVQRAASPEWRAFLEAEQAWLDADEQCRTSLVGDHIADVQALHDAFEKEHAEQIDEVARGWVTIREDAAALGWAPDRPFAR